MGTAAERAAAIVAECARVPAGVIAECGGHGMGPAEQVTMVEALLQACEQGGAAPRGISIASYLLSGALAGDGPPVHGMSVGEPCVDWVATESLVRAAAAAVRARRGGGQPAKRARKQ